MSRAFRLRGVRRDGASASTRSELPVLTADPRFGGGSRSLTSAFWRASEMLGEFPRLYYVSLADGISPRRRPRLVPIDETHGPLSGVAFPSVLPELDGVNQTLNARRIATHLGDAPFLWVVAPSAPYGAAALHAGRPYAIWLATGLEDEWASRAGQLTRPRRAALRVNRPALRRLERDVIRGADAVFAISPASRSTIAAGGGLAEGQVQTLPIPVDLTRFTPLPDDEWEARLERPAIVFVGRGGDPRKNIGLLLEAFRRLRTRLPDARLVLVGEPPRAEILARGGPGVEVAGTVDSVAAVLRTGALLVLSSLQEGFGIVVTEGFACGVPAIVTPCGGPEDLVRRSGAGVVLDGFDPDELAAAAESLLTDRNRLLELRRLGRAYVEQEHSPERLVALLAEPFAQLRSRAGR